MEKIRVLLADDHTVLRQGIAQALELQGDIAVVAQASNGTDAVKLAHKLKFSVKVGRGLCYKTVKAFKGIHEIDEFSIGHSIISRALMTGMRDAVEEMVRLVRAL